MNATNYIAAEDITDYLKEEIVAAGESIERYQKAQSSIATEALAMGHKEAYEAVLKWIEGGLKEYEVEWAVLKGR